jgi:hypothetical protein
MISELCRANGVTTNCIRLRKAMTVSYVDEVKEDDRVAVWCETATIIRTNRERPRRPHHSGRE